MASANKFVDDLTRVMSGAAGVAQSALGEAENTMKSWTQRWVADQGYVTRDEFEAVSDMAKKARSENAALREELDALKAAIGASSGNAQSDMRKTTKAKK